MHLILASGSPRRLALLEQLGLSPVVRPADIDETPLPNEMPAAHVERLALEKGAAVDAEPGDTVISADTIVTIDGALLGKPRDRAHATTMLRRLSGRTHQVMTGVAVRSNGDTTSFVETTSVHFAKLSEDDIAWYVDTGEPFDKAGAYALQGRGGAFVIGIEGSYDNVIGLPRHRLRGLVDLNH
ncbi:MAG: septum formation protein [Verrucomicrobiales bacterium]